MFFMALHHTGPLVRYLETRAYEAIDAPAKRERKQARRQAAASAGRDQSLATKLWYASAGRGQGDRVG